MFRLSDVRLLVVVALLFGALPWAVSARAQEDEEEYFEPRRPRSLSQRLEQFRRDLLGSKDAEEETEPSPKPTPRSTRSKSTATRSNTAVKTPPTSTQAATKPSAPKSRIVARDQQPPRQGVRVASKPTKEKEDDDSPFVQAAPGGATPAETNATEPTSADETRPGKLSATTARPARRGGGFELPTPRLARSEQTEELEEEVVEEPQAFVESTTAPRVGNVLFTAKSPLLSVEATGPRKVLVGREAEFNIVLRNVGEVVGTGIVVKVNIPPYAEVVSAEPTGGSASAPAVSEQPATLEWKVDRLDTRGRETLHLKIVPRKSIPLDLGMQWTCAPETTQAVVEVQEPKLSLSISGPREVFFGQSKIYKLTIANPGNGDAENVNVSLMPIGRSGDAPSNYRLGILRAGDSKTIDIELTARQAGTLEIKAQAFGDDGLRADVVEPVVVRRAQLKIAIAGSRVKFAGTPGIYRIRVANAGDAAANGVELSTMLPPNAKFLKASNGGKYHDPNAKVVWQVGTMQPGDDRTFDVQCVLATPGDNSVQAVAQAGDDLSASATTVTQVEALADLKLEVRDTQGPVAVGDDAQYEVVVRNRGTKAAEGIDIVTFFSEGLEATSVEGIDHKTGAGQVAMKTIPMIAPGAETMIRVHCKADRGGNLVFRAEINCRNPGTKLAAEETTHFYGDEAAAAEPTTEAVEQGVPVEGEPTSAEVQPDSRYPERGE